MKHDHGGNRPAHYHSIVDLLPEDTIMYVNVFLAVVAVVLSVALLVSVGR